MGQISKYGESEIELNQPCVSCGKTAGHYGGWYHGGGDGDLLVCSDCVEVSDLNAIGIAIGDAIVDKYRRNFPKDQIHTSTLVRSVLQRLELSIFRAIASGLYHDHVRKAS